MKNEHEGSRFDVNEAMAQGARLTVAGTNNTCRLGPLLGTGGQGEVYAADLGGQTVAVKWFFPESATPGQRSILEKLVRAGSPDSRFLWPTAIVGRDGDPSFGYVMAVRDRRYGNISDLMTRRLSSTFRSLATAGVGLADGYYRLHSKGWCYRDISHNNVFLDPVSGDVLICDNDNVGPDGAETEIGGTIPYMAPEVVRGERPSARTDLHSLAVLLFLMLMNHHPLEGARESKIHCFDFLAKRRLYGDDPLFIFDPSNNDNHPEPVFHHNAVVFWPLYPRFIRELFTEAFTKGLHDPHARVTEGRWRQAMSRLRDAVFYCAACNRQNLYDAASVQASGGDPGPCWGCGKKLVIPLRIRVGKSTVMLNHDSKLFAHHLDDTAPFGFDNPVAEVTRHPRDPNVWGLKNLGSTQWTAIGQGGAMLQIDPGRSITLASGTKLQFGRADGEIRS